MTESLEKLAPLLSEFQRWRNSSKSGDVSLMDYAGFVATPDTLGALVALLFPECTMHAGRYFLADKFDSHLYDSWMKKLNSQEETQKVLNHVHVSTLLQDQNVPDDLARACADVIRDAWSVSLRSLGVHAESGGTSLDDAYITFYG